MGLPRLGLGLSTNLRASAQPHPWRLLEAQPGLFDYVEYSAPLALRDARAQASLFGTLWRERERVPAVFHPVHLNLYGPQPEPDETLRALAAHVRSVGSPWVSNDAAWWHVDGRFFPGYRYVAPPLDAQGLASCDLHVRRVQAAVDVPLLVENPTVVARRGDLHVLEFLAALHERTGCGLLLDLGHLLAFQLAYDLPPDAALDALPWPAVLELHVAGGVVTRRGARRFYFDDHPQPIREEVFALLAAVRPRCTNLRAVTYEGDGHPDALAAATLARLRDVVGPADASDRLAWPLARKAATAPSTGEVGGDEGAWHLLEVRLGAAPDTVDPEGGEAELELRLAVLGEILDRAFPLTRRVLGEPPAVLRAFSASPELGAWLRRGEGGDLLGGFARFARRRVREGDDEATALALAFEEWALAETGRPRPPPGAGEVALAPGVHVGSFPADLGEAVHALGALAAHVAGRAEASGRWDASACESLRQTVARAPRRPWRVVLQRRDGRVRLLQAPAEVVRALEAAARGGAAASFAARSGVPAWAVERARGAGLLRLGAPD